MNPKFKTHCYQIISLLLLVCTIPLSYAENRWIGEQLNGEPCSGKGQGFGPFDYIAATAPGNRKLFNQSRIWEVDKIHFGKGLTILNKRGVTPKTMRAIFREFDYTLRAFPNHLPALNAIMKVEMQRIALNNLGKEKIQKLSTPPECYFQVAMKFRPKQPQIPHLYAIYLYKKGQYKQSQKLYQQALDLDSNYAEAHYNYGLLLFKLKDYKLSKKHALRSRELGFRAKGLLNKLNTHENGAK